MKKITLLLLIFFSAATITLHASIGANPSDNGAGYRQKVEMLKRISTMSVKEFEAFTGKHLNFINRTLFKMEQKKLRHSIDDQGNISNKKLDKYLKRSGGDGDGFHLGGFALGFLLGLIGILIAYLINDDKKRNRVKWSWIGFGAWLIIVLLLII